MSLLATKTRPGPWRWFGDTRNCDIYLATRQPPRFFVMGFKRWGMEGAAPMFQANRRMVSASELARFEVGDPDILGHAEAKKSPSVYRFDIASIDQPDARLIEAAPELRQLLARALEGGIDDALRAEALEVLRRIEEGPKL